MRRVYMGNWYREQSSCMLTCRNSPFLRKIMAIVLVWPLSLKKTTACLSNGLISSIKLEKGTSELYPWYIYLVLGRYWYGLSVPVEDLGFYRYQFLVYILAILSYLRVSILVLICACYTCICTADISISVDNSQNKAILFMVLFWEFLVVLLYFKQASYDDSQVCIGM